MSTFQFCEHCIEDVQAAWNTGEDHEDPALANNEVLMHDGVRLTVVHVCDRHSGAVIECGVRNWGVKLSDEALAFPGYLN